MPWWLLFPIVGVYCQPTYDPPRVAIQLVSGPEIDLPYNEYQALRQQYNLPDVFCGE